MADLIFGLSIMIYLQGISGGTKAINVQPLLKDWRPNQSYLRDDIWKRLSNEGRYGDYGETPASPPNFSGSTAKIVREVATIAGLKDT